jgi:Cytosine deaminase and related metal-dependent hydrolases
MTDTADEYVIEGGHVLTPDFDVIEADVLIDRNAGEVLAVDDNLDAAETLDATGSLVMPGLVNAHTHVAMTLLRGYADDKPLDAWLQEDIWPVEAELTPEDIRVGTELGLVEFITNGITGFADSYFEVPEIVAATEASGLRANLCHAFISVGKDDEGARADAQKGLDIAREFDGAADGRITTALMPHSLTTVETEYLAEFVPQAREAGVPLHFHANETENEVDPIVDDHGVRPLEYADDLGMLTEDDFLAHCVHVDDAEIDLLAETGASVIHCPASNMKLASGIAPIQELLDAGVNVGLGTDGAASNNDLDLFDEIRDAAMLGKLARGDARDVAAESAVRMATEGSASAIGLPVGQLEAGGTADIAVVDFDAPHLTPVHDHVSHLAYAVRGSDVRHTICDGEILMADREVQTLDEAAIRERASEHASDLVARAE